MVCVMKTPTQAANEIHEAGWSEAQIAKAVDVNQSTIHRIRNGAEPAFSLGVAILALADEIKNNPNLLPGTRSASAT